MKKIQITTVQKTANVEVIELNSSFVAKSVRAGDAAQEALRALNENAPLKPVLDDNGCEVLDDNGEGKVLMETDWDEWRRRGYSGINVQDLLCKTIPFAVELRDALLDS